MNTDEKKTPPAASTAGACAAEQSSRVVPRETAAIADLVADLQAESMAGRLRFCASVTVDADGRITRAAAGRASVDQVRLALGYLRKMIDEDCTVPLEVAQRENEALRLLTNEIPNPPRRMQEDAHKALEELLRRLQARYESGEMKCLATISTDAQGLPSADVAGYDVGGHLPEYLAELASSVTKSADWSSDDEKQSTH